MTPKEAEKKLKTIKRFLEWQLSPSELLHGNCAKTAIAGWKSTLTAIEGLLDDSMKFTPLAWGTLLEIIEAWEPALPVALSKHQPNSP